jgi:site-specific DNA-methyltransferase (adenine-specific)
VTFQLLHGDCREALAVFAPASFDAAIADPPYGDTSLSWDRICPGWVPAVARVLKPAASVWVFGSLRFLAPMFAEMERHGFRYSQDIVWEKQNGTGLHNDRFRRVHEHAVLFYRGAWSDVYHDTQFTNDATARTVRRKTKPPHWSAVEPSHYASEDGGPRLMRSVLRVRNEHGRAIHPTQKPIDLLTPLIRYSVPPGGSFVVPFAGSGAELVAGYLEGRRGVGVELNAEHHARAAEWLARLEQVEDLV